MSDPVNSGYDQLLPETGPRGWKRIFDGLARVFKSGSNGPLLPTGANTPQNAQSNLPLEAMYRAKIQAADAANRDRQSMTAAKRKVYENDIRDFVEEKLRNAFHPENYARLFFTIHCSTNVLRRIVHETSILYENPAKRELKDKSGKDPYDKNQSLPAEPQAVALPADKTLPPTTSSAPPTPDNKPKLETGDADVDRLASILDLTGTVEEENEPFQKLMEAFDWDVLLDQVEKYSVFCPVVWVRPYVVYEYDEKNQPKADTGKLCYIIYTPENADVVTHPNDPSQAIAWYYFAEEFYRDGTEVKTREVIHFWNVDVYMKFDKNWTMIAGPTPNYLGRLPCAEFRIDRPNLQSFFCDGVGNDLYEGTLEVNVLKTIQNQRAKDGGFKQLAIQGGDEKTMADQVMGGPTPIFTGDDSTVSVLDLQPALQQFTDMWEKRENSLVAAYGVNVSEYKNEGSSRPQSGFAKKLDRDKILKESRRRRKFFAMGEQDLYEVTCLELKANPVPDIPALDETMDLEVDFSEPTFEEDPEVQARIDALELEFSATNIIEILRRKNPDLTDIELVKMAFRNREINKVFMTSEQMTLTQLLANGATQIKDPNAGGGGKPNMSGGGSGGSSGGTGP